MILVEAPLGGLIHPKPGLPILRILANRVRHSFKKNALSNFFTESYESRPDPLQA
jgi:hypothetical protein